MKKNITTIKPELGARYINRLGEVLEIKPALDFYGKVMPQWVKAVVVDNVTEQKFYPMLNISEITGKKEARSYYLNADDGLHRDNPKSGAGICATFGLVKSIKLDLRRKISAMSDRLNMNLGSSFDTSDAFELGDYNKTKAIIGLYR